MTRLATLLPFALAAGLSAGAAWLAAQAIEGRTERDAARALQAEGLDFARVEADGLRLTLTGAAPSEAQRFRALSAAGRVVDPARVIDALSVEDAAEVAPPRYAVEMLRGGEGLSLIGLVPEGTDRAAIRRRLERATGLEVSDFLETAAHPVPEGWPGALEFALAAATALPRAKISADAERVAVTAAAGSPEERRRIEADLRRAKPDGLALDLAVSAPRPVIAPFTLRFEMGDGRARLAACAAATPEGAARIEAAARAAGALDPACRLGLGAPSPRWPEAAERAIAAVAEMGGGSATLADADATLVAPADLPAERFDAVAGALEGALPDAFSLHAVPAPEAAAGAPVFSAMLEGGRLTLSGRLPHERARAAAESLVRARFPGAELRVTTRTAGGLPEGWPVRALAGIEALALLKEGRVVVEPDTVALSGVAGDKDAEAEAAGLLARALGGGEDLRIEVAYDPALDPETAGPTPEACLARIEAAQGAVKIAFAPGSADLEPASLPAVNEIAGALRDCPDLALEVAGHTDAQGREAMNLELSRARAEAVVEALAARQAPVSGLRPVGYGEARPLAGNDTEDGRERNRRIEFTPLPPPGEAPRPAAATAPAPEGSDAAGPPAVAEQVTRRTGTPAALGGAEPPAAAAARPADPESDDRRAAPPPARPAR